MTPLRVNSPASSIALGLFALGLSLVTSAAWAQTVISTDDPVDRILLHHDKARDWARAHRDGTIAIEAIQHIPRGFDTQLAPRLRGAALLVRTPEGQMLITPRNLVENASSVHLLLPAGPRLPVQGIHLHPDVPLARLDARGIPEDMKALSLAADEAASEGRRALHISGLDVPADPALHRAHLLRRPLPPLVEYWIPDVRHPDGHPLLTHEGRLLAVAFRGFDASGTQSIAAGPALLRRVIADLYRQGRDGPSKALK